MRWLIGSAPDFRGRDPRFESSISHNDPDELQDHCVIKVEKNLRVEKETYPCGKKRSKNIYIYNLTNKGRSPFPTRDIFVVFFLCLFSSLFLLSGGSLSCLRFYRKLTTHWHSFSSEFFPLWTWNHCFSSLAYNQWATTSPNEIFYKFYTMTPFSTPGSYNWTQDLSASAVWCYFKASKEGWKSLALTVDLNIMPGGGYVGQSLWIVVIAIQVMQPCRVL